MSIDASPPLGSDVPLDDVEVPELAIAMDLRRPDWASRIGQNGPQQIVGD